MTALAWLGAGVILAGCAAHATAAREASPATAGMPRAEIAHAQVEVLLPGR